MGRLLSNGPGRILLRSGMVGLAVLVVAGLLILRESRTPRNAWLRLIHGTDRVGRADGWARLRRDRAIPGLDEAETIREVIAALGDADPENRLRAASVLPILDADPVEAIAALRSHLSDTDTDAEVRVAVTSAIGGAFHRGGSGRDESLNAIEAALKDDSAAVRSTALASLGQILYESGKAVDPLRSGQADDPALGLATARLQDADPSVRIEAAFVLACNDRGRDAEPMLEAYLRAQPVADPPSHEADRAFLAVMVLAVQSDRAATFLGSEMTVPRDGHPERPRDALAWAAKQSPEARLRVKRVATHLLDPANPPIRYNAALLLHRIGSDQPARPILVESLGDPSVEIRRAAVEALAEIGAYDPTIATDLEIAAEDEDEGVRQQAAAAIEAIEWAELLAEIEGTP